MKPFGYWETKEGTLYLIKVDVNRSDKITIRFKGKRMKTKVKWDRFSAYIVWENERYYLNEASHNGIKEVTK